MNITNCIMNIKKSVIGMLLLLGGPSASWAQTDHRFEVMQNLDVFNSIYKQLDMLYVDTLDPKMTIGAGINAMLKSLDPYTEYYPAEKKSEDRKSTRLNSSHANISYAVFSLKKKKR